jgi:hypothetical protein
MRRSLHLGAVAIAAVTFFSQCETPSEPKFKTQQVLEVPILKSANFTFLGGKGALIDTTKGDIGDLLTIDANGLVILSKETEFEFGDLNDAIPEVSVDPTDVNAQVGDLNLGSFASNNADGLGRANFQQLTTLNPALFSAGTPLPGGSSPFPVNIDVSTDYFVSATIRNGALSITLRNTLGFNLSSLTMQLRSGNTVVGTFNFANLNHNSQLTETLPLAQGTLLADINMNVSIAWAAQQMQATPQDLIVQDVAGVGLTASQVVAVLPGQSFDTRGSFSVDPDQFIFGNMNDFIEMSGGALTIASLDNNMDITIADFILSFPTIRRPPYTPADSLVIRFTGPTRINARSSITNFVIPMANVRLYAPNNEVRYNLAAVTLNNQLGIGSTPSTVNSSDNVSARIRIENLAIRQAFGTIKRREVDLNDDDPSNGANIDLFNDNEANLIEIDGISDLSDKVGGLEFTDARFLISYNTNIGIGAKVVGAFVGVDSKGERVYLTGKTGSPYAVASNPFTNLTTNSIPLAASQMIQFELATSPDGSLVPGVIEFNKNNSTIIEFLNTLPTEIRFVGKAVINENETRGQIQSPVRFEPVILVDIPLAIKTVTAASYDDTLKADMGNLPGPDDDTRLNSGALEITYANRLPLQIGMELIFLDANFQPVTRTPLTGAQAHTIQAAPVGSNGFVSGPRNGTLTITLNQSQLDVINRARHVALSASLLTTNSGEVRLRNTDGFSFGIKARFTLTSSYD